MSKLRGKPTCAVWYVSHYSLYYELCDDEDEAVGAAWGINDAGTGAVLGVQFSDGRALPVDGWPALRAAEERMNAAPSEPVKREPRPVRHVRSPLPWAFPSETIEVDAAEPAWLGRQDSAGSAVPWVPPANPPDPAVLAGAMLAPLDEDTAAALAQARSTGISLTYKERREVGNLADAFTGANELTYPLVLTVHGDPPAEGLTVTIQDGEGWVEIPERCYVDHASVSDSSVPPKELVQLRVDMVCEPGDKVGGDLRKLTFDMTT